MTTWSPTATGLVERIPFKRKLPLILLSIVLPSSVFTVYQLPVFFITKPRIKIKKSGPSPLPLPQREGSNHRDSPNNSEKVIANITIENRNNSIDCNYKPSVAYIGNLPGKDYQPLIISTPFTKMLVHKMRAENDAILVGKTTEELEQPQLTVREWSGPSPEKLVLTSQPTKAGEYATPAEVLSHLYAEKKQSLIVEGGAKTLQSFLDAGLWDEIRIESAPFTVNEGTRSAKTSR